MNDDQGPWRQPPPPPPRRPGLPGGRLAAFLVSAAVVALLILALAKAFPEAVRSGEDRSQILLQALVVLVVGTGVFRLSRTRWLETARYAAAWLGIIAVLAVGYAYRTELQGVIQRVQGAFGPGVPIATAPHELVINQDDQGAFLVIGQVNGQRVRFIVDTGSSDTVLSPADAQMLGVDVGALRYDRTAETANGLGSGAAFVADSLAVGPIRMTKMPMTINQAPMSASLLGMSFLSRLDSFEIRGRTLHLKWSGAQPGTE